MREFKTNGNGIRLWKLHRMVRESNRIQGDAYLYVPSDLVDRYAQIRPCDYLSGIREWRRALRNQFFYANRIDADGTFCVACPMTDFDGSLIVYVFRCRYDGENVFLSSLPEKEHVVSGIALNWIDVKPAYRRLRGY